MLKNKTIAVVVPCYNEEKQIGNVIKTMPNFVDRIVVIDNLSLDKTKKVVLDLIKKETKPRPKLRNKETLVSTLYNEAELLAEKIYSLEKNMYPQYEVLNEKNIKGRIILINHAKNEHVGGAIAAGYRWCRDNNIDCVAVMAGDGQMDPGELENICLPVAKGEVDYVKANRLRHTAAFLTIPKIRFFGNSILSLFTKIASGYWRVSDTQTGYTAISLRALKLIKIHKIYYAYGCPNDILVKLNIANCTIREIDSKPVYRVGEKSKMKEFRVIPKISILLVKLFFERLYTKYFFRDFHPLFLLYHMAFLLLVLSFISFISLLIGYNRPFVLPLQSLVLFMFLTISGFQSLLFAMWMDIMDNDRLYK